MQVQQQQQDEPKNGKRRTEFLERLRLRPRGRILEPDKQLFLWEDDQNGRDTAPAAPRSDGLWPYFEQITEQALKLSGYSTEAQVADYGTRDHGGSYKLDILAALQGEPPVAVSCKWQRVSGSWDLKTTEEFKALDRAAKAHGHRAYIVLGGPGWSDKKKAKWCGRIDKWGQTSLRIDPGVYGNATTMIVDFNTFMAIAFMQEL